MILKFNIAYTPESLQEIIHIVEWYNNASKGLGSRFRKNLLAEIAAIKQNPLTRSFRYDNVRFAVVNKFPYAAHYTVDEQTGLIIIQAVLGFSQNDKENWKVRKQ